MTLAEMMILARRREKRDEFDFVSLDIFKKYNLCLNYTYVMEYCKLLEPKVKGKNHYASLNKLNSKVLSIHGNDYKSDFDDVEVLIQVLRDSEFAIKLRRLRDQTFAHADKTESDNIFNIAVLDDSDLETALTHFFKLREIFQRCGNIYHVEYFIASIDDDSTENFIKNASKVMQDYNY
ncbi:hypothetical protein [Pedobacter steynii]